ncbi:unnamed protein product [Mesocestoides corti]|uniref:PDZ domain-containing protein n=1 Tax=Mesocestoides corti TaxID=53468 RepID=A0A3P6GEE7_MESCO|nr:unnamed protein product [Mesocestoides corti]
MIVNLIKVLTILHCRSCTVDDFPFYSSITDSTMSLNIITVTLNMDSVNFLGISIVGQSTKSGDDGIYVGSIMKGGAVAQDGRIEPGDMILEVNGISFEEMSNDDAVRTLREQVQNPGYVYNIYMPLITFYAVHGALLQIQFWDQKFFSHKHICFWMQQFPPMFNISCVLSYLTVLKKISQGIQKGPIISLI